MSQHVTCRSGLRCLPIAIFGAEPNSEFFCQPFGMKGPMQLWGSDRFFGCNQSGRDWYHVKGTISGILGAPDVLRVKCTSSSSTPASLFPGGALVRSLVTHVWHVTSCHKLSNGLMMWFHVVYSTSCSAYLEAPQCYFALGMIFSSDLVSPISYQSYQKVIQKVTQKYGGVFIFLRILLDDHFQFWSKNQPLARSQEKSIMS